MFVDFFKDLVNKYFSVAIISVLGNNILEVFNMNIVSLLELFLI